MVPASGQLRPDGDRRRRRRLHPRRLLEGVDASTAELADPGAHRVGGCRPGLRHRADPSGAVRGEGGLWPGQSRAMVADAGPVHRSGRHGPGRWSDRRRLPHRRQRGDHRFHRRCLRHRPHVALRLLTAARLPHRLYPRFREDPRGQGHVHPGPHRAGGVLRPDDRRGDGLHGNSARDRALGGPDPRPGQAGGSRPSSSARGAGSTKTSTPR